MLSFRVLLPVVLFRSAFALAGVVTVRDAAGGENGYFVNGTSGTVRATFNGGTWASYWVGVDDFEMSSGGAYTPVKAFCIEPTQYLSFGTNPNDTAGKSYTLTQMSADGSMSSGLKTNLSRLWANACSQAATSNVAAAAFQAVIWELILDSTANLSGGNFRLNGDDTFTGQVKSTAQTWLDNLAGTGWTATANLFSLRSSASQDLVTNVPEPGTIALFAMAGLLAFYRTRRH